jgi:uncharacterized protein
MKTVNFNETLYNITEQYPELIPALAKQGFGGVTNEKMRTSHGKEMTIIKGCADLGIDYKKVAKALEAEGFTVTNCPV